MTIADKIRSDRRVKAAAAEMEASVRRYENAVATAAVASDDGEIVDPTTREALELWALENLGDTAWVDDIIEVLEDPEGTLRDIERKRDE